jgi:hypothetical protein
LVNIELLAVKEQIYDDLAGLLAALDSTEEEACVLASSETRGVPV